MARKPTERAAVQTPLILLGGAFVAAALTQANAQVINRGSVLKLAEANNRLLVDKAVPARRGSIATSDGKVLAQSVESYELGVSLGKVPRSPGFAVDMAAATGLPASEFDGDPAAAGKYKIFQQPLTGPQARSVKEVRRKWRADGVSLVPVLNREYPMSGAASNFAGIVRDKDGITGLERSLNPQLKGSAGKIEGFVDRTGLFMPSETAKGKESVDGADVVLTIDSSLQSVAAQALREAVENHNATRGSAVVLDPKTGDVLALASWPGYDPDGAICEGADIEAGTMAVLEPGSTFKVLTLAQALDSHAVTTDWQSNCPGQIEVTKGRFVRCDEHHGNRAHGAVDLDKAVAKSCNVSAVTWAQGIGREGMLDMMKRLGLFEKPDLGLPGEVRGRYNLKDVGFKMQLANFGFGQALASTPAALAGAYATLANGGLRMKLRLIKSIGGKETPVKEAGHVFTPATSDLVKSYMKSVVEMRYGTGFSLRIDGYPMAGKTGTAQKVGAKGPSGHVSSFVGFVPATDTKAVILVMVDDPKKGGYYGADVAGPVFHELAKAVVKRYALAPQAMAPVASSEAIEPAKPKPVAKPKVRPSAKPAPHATPKVAHAKPKLATRPKKTAASGTLRP